jgi:hypothetical protein
MLDEYYMWHKDDKLNDSGPKENLEDDLHIKNHIIVCGIHSAI